MCKRIIWVVLLLVGSLLLAATGAADRESDVIRISAQVVSSCEVSADPLRFDRNLRLRERRDRHEDKDDEDDEDDEEDLGKSDKGNRGKRSHGGKHRGLGTNKFNWRIRVKCIRRLPYHLAADAGEHLFSGVRHMVNEEGHRVGYRLFKKGRSGEEWGDGDLAGTYPTGTSISAKGKGNWKTHVVHGILFRNSGGLRGGVYTDNVKVSVHN